MLDRQSRASVASNSFISDDQCSFNPEYQVLYGAGIVAVCELLHSALFGRSKGTRGASPAARTSQVFPLSWLATADEVIDLLRLLTATHGTCETSRCDQATSAYEGRAVVREHADASHPLALLRARIR